MHITILCLKVKQKQACKQSLYVVKKWNYYVNTKNNSKIDFLTTIIDVLLTKSGE